MYTEKIIKHVFPNATVKVFSPGHTANLIIRVDGQAIYEKKKNGKMDEKNAQEVVRQIAALAK